MASVYSTENRIEIKGIPFQGHGIFKDYYALFRGKGYILTNSDKSISGLYNSLLNFFTSHYILAFNFSDNAKELRELVKSPLTSVVHIVATNLEKQKTATAVLTDFLSENNKILSSFRISPNIEDFEEKQHDLAIYRILQSFPSDKSSSLPTYKEHLTNTFSMCKSLIIGGFLLIVMPRDSENLDLLLSGIEAVSGSLCSMVYTGVVMFDPLKLPVWIFRKEPLNTDIIMARTNMARKRLRRHLKVFEEVVEELAPENAVLVTLGNTLPSVDTFTQKVLKTKVTPSHELIKLFEILKRNYPREIINATLPYQIKYDKVLEEATNTTSKNVLVPLLNEMLYDFAVSVARKEIPSR